MSTGLDIINRAARAAHILAAGEQLDSISQNDALTIANGMLDTWNSERLMIFTIQRLLFPLLSGQQVYTVGTGGNFNIPRPPKIENYGVITLNNPTQPLELPLDNYTKDEWAAIPVKGIQAALPSVVWDDNQFPLRNINLWPIPNVSTLQIAIYPWSALTALTLAGTFTFPPAYYECLVYNLAARYALEWPGDLTPTLVEMAQESMSRVKTMNAPIVDLKCDPALNSPALRAYNWISDTPIAH